MKWIEIAKAKPKFKADYLVMAVLTAGVVPAVAHLDATTQTQEGLKHTFRLADSDTIVDVTHIALITLPGTKEVENG